MSGFGFCFGGASTILYSTILGSISSSPSIHLKKIIYRPLYTTLLYLAQRGPKTKQNQARCGLWTAVATRCCCPLARLFLENTWKRYTQLWVLRQMDAFCRTTTTILVCENCRVASQRHVSVCVRACVRACACAVSSLKKKSVFQWPRGCCERACARHRSIFMLIRSAARRGRPTWKCTAMRTGCDILRTARSFSFHSSWGLRLMMIKGSCISCQLSRRRFLWASSILVAWISPSHLAEKVKNHYFTGTKKYQVSQILIRLPERLCIVPGLVK